MALARPRFAAEYLSTRDASQWPEAPCLDPDAEQLEVDSSHIGMALARSVWTLLAAELGS